MKRIVGLAVTIGVMNLAASTPAKAQDSMSAASLFTGHHRIFSPTDFSAVTQHFQDAAAGFNNGQNTRAPRDAASAANPDFSSEAADRRSRNFAAQLTRNPDNSEFAARTGNDDFSDSARQNRFANMRMVFEDPAFQHLDFNNH